MSNARIILAGALGATAGLSFAPAFGGFGPGLVLAVLAPPAAAAGWALWARWAARRSLQVPGNAHQSPAYRIHLPLRHTALGILTVAAAVAAATRPGVAAASGPQRLLTGALPADPNGPELAAASAVTGYAALIGCYLVLTRRAPLAPVLPALLCLLTGLGLGATTGDLPAWYPLAFVALAGLLLATARPSASSGVAASGARTFIAGGTRMLIAATVILAVGMAVSIPLTNLALGSGSREPADLRSAIAAPVQPKTHTNPLAQYLALRDDRQPLLTGSASEPVDRLRMVTLTEFNGHTWSTRVDYRRAGHRLPPAATATDIRREVTIDVSVSDPDVLGWLPTAGRPTDISIAGLGVDENTGDIVIPTGSDTPASYRVTGAEPIIGDSDVLLDEPAPAAAPFDIDLTPDILGFITAATSGQPTDSDRFFALYRSLTGPPFGDDRSPEAAGGHALYQISAMLRDKRGTSEQFASAFAVMCRHLGWDARVVLGFRPQWSGNTLTVTGKNVHAWVEVRFNQLGWIPVDPTPVQASPGGASNDEQTPPRNPADNPIGSAAANAPQQPPPEPADTPPPAPVAAPTGQPTRVVLTIIGGGLLALVTLAIPAAKTIRRIRRRRTGTARTRIIAGWREALDALRETGRQLPRQATTGDIIAIDTNETGGIPELRTLAWKTDYVAFSPDVATDADALNAWADSDTIRKVVHHELRFSGRLRAAFDPRPLFNC
jgi:transglutaminase-like putative cysteine protease